MMMDNNNMLNLASSSNEGNISSSKKRNNEEGGGGGNIIEDATNPAAKKRRNLPGNPDPEGEIIALSPRTLMATNRFVCEICHKGFQREQNLQLHRRGHNLPWKLKQRANKDVIKKKFYVCPEPSCVHHDPSRALGDLTGVKKHYCRKHGEKKWKCEKCTKRYAVQSDWKAHSKVCGTREYRCDCGTIFSRRDSFITHRAFCDALAQESARTVSQNPLLSSSSSHQQPGTTSSNTIFNLQTQLHNQVHQARQASSSSQLKREQDLQQQSFNLRPEIPPWLVGPPSNDLSSQLFTSRLDQPAMIMSGDHNNHNLPFSSSSVYNNQITKASPHMSATALLQKAAEMGVTMSKTCQSESGFRPHLQASHHMSAPEYNSTGGVALGLSSSEEIIGNAGSLLHHGFESFINKAPASNTVVMEQISSSTLHVGSSSSLINNNTNGGFERSTNFDETFNRMMVNSRNGNVYQEAIVTQSADVHLSGNGEGGGNEGLTIDFLGLTAFPHRDFMNMAGLDQMGSSSYDHHHQQNQNQTQWHG